MQKTAKSSAGPRYPPGGKRHEASAVRGGTGLERPKSGMVGRWAARFFRRAAPTLVLACLFFCLLLAAIRLDGMIRRYNTQNAIVADFYGNFHAFAAAAEQAETRGFRGNAAELSPCLDALGFDFIYCEGGVAYFCYEEATLATGVVGILQTPQTENVADGYQWERIIGEWYYWTEI